MSSSTTMTTAPVAARFVPHAAQQRPADSLPLYLVHGFRWPRKAIRIHVILHNLEDAAPDYTMSSSSNAAMIASLRRLHPDILTDLSDLRMVEEYDPEDENPANNVQEFAYVADKVIPYGPGVDLKKLQEEGISSAAWGAMADLREELAKGEQLGWWLVYNADPERGMDSDDFSDSQESVHEKKSESTVKKWFRRSTKTT